MWYELSMLYLFKSNLKVFYIGIIFLILGVPLLYFSIQKDIIYIDKIYLGIKVFKLANIKWYTLKGPYPQAPP